MTKSTVSEAVRNHMSLSNIHEFALFCIARQGGKTAVEILARAFIMEGKHVYVGQSLTGKRSMGTNSLIFRYSDIDNVPPGISINIPEGIMLMHEALIIPDVPSGLGQSNINRFEALKQHTGGLLMVNTTKDPEEVDYPVDFQGTVATVDAEGIFIEKVGTQPPPSGITALGLFAKATGLIKIKTLSKAVMEHERLSKRVREINVACMEEAYEKTKVSHDIMLKAKPALQEAEEVKAEISTLWRTDLPKCDTTKCVCIECIAAFYCPDAVIKWEDEMIIFDYDNCKSCGTCAKECPENAISMVNDHID